MRALALHATPQELQPVLSRCAGAAWVYVDDPAEVGAALSAHRPEVVLSIKSLGMPAPVHRPALTAAGVGWFHVGGSGIEHLGSWDPARTTVTTCVGVLAPFLGERALAAMLHLTSGHRALELEQRERRWSPSRFVPLSGRTLLVVGLGQTGAALASRAKALGMRVLATRRHPAPHPAADEVHPPEALDALLPRADVVSLHVRHTPETTGLLSAPRLARLPRGAFVLNSARGPVLDTEALLAALDSGRLGGAWLDVFDTEPLPPTAPLWDHPRVMITPHCADQVVDWPQRFAERFVENWERRARGEPLLSVAVPPVG